MARHAALLGSIDETSRGLHGITHSASHTEASSRALASQQAYILRTTPGLSSNFGTAHRRPSHGSNHSLLPPPLHTQRSSASLVSLTPSQQRAQELENTGIHANELLRVHQEGNLRTSSSTLGLRQMASRINSRSSASRSNLRHDQSPVVGNLAQLGGFEGSRSTQALATSGELPPRPSGTRRLASRVGNALSLSGLRGSSGSRPHPGDSSGQAASEFHPEQRPSSSRSEC